ncbi:SP_0009 family protein [Streptococcus hillyeri]|uniref:Recombinase n=1 Tax=Streptococcus hillyeri TaxID=2282420 RepID=A0A3L9DSN8_9STRE|nr:SP_0009 family protein [Streptococcus hillyeri]RLY03454.1 recombinase [Streptococcus hillyeri]
MDNLIKTVETFLAYSEEKLEELADKNRALKAEREQFDKMPNKKNIKGS